MGRDPYGEEEPNDAGHQPRSGEVGGHGRPDGYVRQVPGRVGRVEQGHVVAPASRLERVERRSVIPTHRTLASTPSDLLLDDPPLADRRRAKGSAAASLRSLPLPPWIPRSRCRPRGSSVGLEHRTSLPPATSSADTPADISHRTSRCSGRGIGPRRTTTSRRGAQPEASPRAYTGARQP